MVRLRLRTAFAVGCLAITTILAFRTQDALAWQAVKITSPANNATVNGIVTVNATVGPKVWWAKLYIDGGDGPVSPPYSFSWNSTTVPNGSHTLTVKAFAEFSSTPLSTSSINVTVSNGSNPTYFSTLPPHASLPTEQQCASYIQATPETNSGNAVGNTTTPSAAELSSFAAQPFWFTYGPTSSYSSYTNNVDGNYTGSTDMILRWAACKWGIDENVVRAEAWVESGWTQSSPTYSTLWPPGWGDFQSSYSQCVTPAWNGWVSAIGGCYQSCGILMTKVADFNVWPEACAGTAFNADFRMAMARACMDGNGESWYSSETPSAGYPYYPNGTTDQLLWGCMGAWYSGSWYDSGALWYISAVQSTLASKPWP